MQTLQSAIPKPELREFIRIFAGREITSDEPASSQPPLISILEQVLSFEIADPMLLDYVGKPNRVSPAINLWGTFTHPFGYHRFRGHTVGFAVFLHPNASWQLFGIPPAVIEIYTLMDRMFLAVLFGTCGISSPKASPSQNVSAGSKTISCH